MQATQGETVPLDSKTGVVRVAAAGDLHTGARHRDLLRAEFAGISERADVLLLAGDLTNRGSAAQGRVLVEELADVDVPIVAVLGNHDFDDATPDEIRRLLREAGVHVLDGTSVVLDLAGVRVGIAGSVGFDGGQDLESAASPQRAEAAALTAALAGLVPDDVQLRISLTHFAPVSDTLQGEDQGLFPYLWSRLLGRAVDEGGADLAIHGHVHYGSEIGRTPGGIPVRNVARFVLEQPYAVYRLSPGAEPVRA